jgi:2-amino-4-hydroxy-6-hydroxymethyldihydropteridine diphosphokinase
LTGYIGLGSNLGDRGAWLLQGIQGLRAAGIRIAAASSLWETEPVDTEHGGWFLNMVVEIRTGRAPLELLEILLGVERRAGRERNGRNGPRNLDLDLLLQGDRSWNDARLVLPHPRMWERSFVLEPLCELAPELRNPESGRTVAEECRRIAGRAVVREVGRLPLAGILQASTPRSSSRDEVQIDRH